MKKYKKTFIKFWDIGEQDVFLCQLPECNQRSVEIHHLIFRSQGGKDNIENLFGICRQHHDLAHADKSFNEKLKSINKKIHL